MAYNSFYLDDLYNIINQVAMESMITPVMERKKADGTVMTLSEISNYNSLVAANNEGIRDYTIQLKAALKELGGDNSDS